MDLNSVIFDSDGNFALPGPNPSEFNLIIASLGLGREKLNRSDFNFEPFC